MSSVLRKIGLGDDSPSDVDTNAKIRKEDEQLFHEADPLDFIDDATLKLRSIEGSVASVDAGCFREILEKMEQWVILGRRKQELGIAADPEQRFIYTEDLMELKAIKAKFEEQLEKIGSEDRLVRKQKNHREVSNSETETVISSQRHVPVQQEQISSPLQAGEQSTIDEDDQEIKSKPNITNVSSFIVTGESSKNSGPVPVETSTVKSTVRRRPPRGPGKYTSDEWTTADEQSSFYDSSDESSTLDEAIEQSAATVKKEEQAAELKPDTQSTHNSSDRFVSSSAFTEVRPWSWSHFEFSNRMKTVAKMNFNAKLLTTLGLICCHVAAKKVLILVNKRTNLIKNPQYKYSLAGQQLFYNELVTELISLKQVLMNIPGVEYTIPDVTSTFQLLFDMIHSDALNSAQFIFPCVRYLTDYDLLECIINNSDSAAAENVLRARKLWLKDLSIRRKFGSINLNLRSYSGDEQGTVAAMNYKYLLGMELNQLDAVNLFKLILSLYDFSKAEISLSSDGSDNMLRFLRWFCPKKVVISCDPQVLVDTHSLLSGVDVIVCETMNADRLMEILKVQVIRLHYAATWSKESFFRVLTAHMLSPGTGRRRTISCSCNARDTKSYKEFFELWKRAFEAEHGNIGRKVTMRDNGCGIECELH